MAPEKILEGNKLIALFMGFTGEAFSNSGGSGWMQRLNGTPEYDNRSCSKYGTIEVAREAVLSFKQSYHSDWNWLMPVVEKINDKCGPVAAINIDSGCTFLHYGSEHNMQMERFVNSETSKIEATWLAVVAFITWYNAQS